ncbi:MAG: hypothetical protein R3254_08740 [Thiomicrorhabdus sp.]|nr:hypothetical protein [Thiomicrorhabdus sp.]
MALKVTGLPQMKRELLTIEKHFEEDAKELQKDVVLTAFGFLATPANNRFGSPVDKGRYIASHQFESTPQTDSAPDGLTEAQYEGIKESNRSDIKGKTFDFKNATFYIANNVAYAEALEAGRSPQAPGQNAIYGKAEKLTQKYVRQEIAKLSKKRY